jgi:hypothetical protein
MKFIKKTKNPDEFELEVEKETTEVKIISKRKIERQIKNLDKEIKQLPKLEKRKARLQAILDLIEENNGKN